jgi:CHAT domain-containing protein
VVTPAGIHHAVLASQPDIAKLAEEYNDAIQKRLADPRRTRIPAGERLFELLIAPLQQWMPAGKPVLIVPDGALSSINFETLPIPGTTPARYWIEDVSIAIAPSISVIGATGKASVGKSKDGLLVIGDPDRTDPDYAPLTHAPEEITRVIRHFDPNGRTVLQRQDASASAYKAANPSRFDAIHFAAHATASRESPLDSAVLLSGSKLYAREVLESPLDASLVTVSACRGVGARNYVGEGLVGFAWAFLRAGARNVVAGLWDVNDQSTSMLMDNLYKELALGKKPAAALRTAKLALIQSGSNFQKPYYWGPFQTYTVDSRPFSKQP